MWAFFFTLPTNKQNQNQNQNQNQTRKKKYKIIESSAKITAHTNEKKGKEDWKLENLIEFILTIL